MSHAYQYNVCRSEGKCMLWFNFILAGVDSFATYAYDCRIIFSVFLGLKTIKNSSGQLPRAVERLSFKRRATAVTLVESNFWDRHGSSTTFETGLSCKWIHPWLKFLSLCFKLITNNYHTQITKENKLKIEPQHVCLLCYVLDKAVPKYVSIPSCLFVVNCAPIFSHEKITFLGSDGETSTLT